MSEQRGSAAAPAPAAPRFGTVSMTVTLAACISLLVLAAVATVLAIQWSVSRDATMELMHGRAANVVDKIKAGARKHLDPAVELAGFLAERIEDDAGLLHDRARLATLLTGSLASVPHISGVVVFDPSQRMLSVRRGDGGAVEVVDADRSGNETVGKIFAEIGANSGVFWGEPLLSSRGVALINLRRPLRRDGALIGLLVVAITVPELSELVTEAGDRFGGTAFILYGRDRVLAHPYLVAARLDSPAEGATVALANVGDIVLGSLWDGQTMPAFEESRAGAGGRVEAVHVKLAGRDYVVLYTWTGDFGAVPWAVGAWFTMADLGTEMRRLMLALLGGIAVLVLALLAAILLGRGIARPVRRLAAGAQRIGDLDLAQVERLPPSMIRELNDQSRAFNTMLTSLKAFETYVPRKLVEKLIRGGERQLESAERDLTVMFTDIVGFTAMSEGLPARELAGFLNHHFALLGSCVEAEGGTVDKFIGDAVMAFWGAPERQKDRAPRACRAALEMARAIEADNVARAAAGLAPVRLRVGIHTGPVVVGNIGWPGRINYTIVGDTVNAGQRLESLGKELDRGDEVTILISGVTAERLDESFEVEPAGRFEVKGKSEPLEVYRLVSKS